MKSSDSIPLEEMVAAHLAGETPHVPASQKDEFELALAAHAALQNLVDDTAIYTDLGSNDRTAPVLPDGYRIEREIGQGGMGVVYLARQESLNRAVALKVLRPGERTFGPLVQRFLTEAKHLARLRHPNIVSIHEVGDANGEPFFTMDYIDGESLSSVIRRGAMSPSQALAILKQVASGIQHAHQQGIIHRDLKPSNVLIDREGTVFVTDFGLARDVSQSSELTQTGELLGTPQYMAPEQARGQSVLIGEATDIHALGLLLFEMLTGRAAFGSSSPADVLVRLLNESPPRLRSIDRRIPRDLETICQKMLEKSPSARYTSVSALLEDIRRFEMGEPLVARRAGPLRLATRWMTRHWKIAASIIVSVILTTAIAAPLFDKSFDELVAWGDEEIRNGNTDVAARVYSRALRGASEAEKELIIDRVVTTCRSMSNSEKAVELALQIIEIAPDVSFGTHDYVIAKTLGARAHGNANLGTINVWNSSPTPVLQLIRSRFEIALKGMITPEQRREAEKILADVNRALANEAPASVMPPENLHELPRGTPAELRQILTDDTTVPWSRVRAGIALGKAYEATRNVPAALDAYARAYELARRVYPFVAGVKSPRGSKSSVDAPDAEACLLVRDLASSLHRLSPNDWPLPTGRLQFEVTGVTMPPDVHIELELNLRDPSNQLPNQGLLSKLPCWVPLRQDTPCSVTLLDGTYQLGPGTSMRRRWDSEAYPEGGLLQVDLPEWPKQITVQGGVVQLDPVHLRMAEEIHLVSPTWDEAIDLATSSLQWSPIAGAAFYRVHLSVRKELPRPTGQMFMAADVSDVRLRFTELELPNRRRVREHLPAGSVAEYQVDAYDNQGKCIGTTLESRRFVVANPLPEE